MKVKISNRKVLEIQSAIEQLGSQKVDVHFAYALAKNKGMIEKDVNALKDTGKWSKEYSDFEGQRQKLCIKHAIKNPDGSPKIIGPIYIMQDQDAFDKELDKLRAKNKQIIEDQEARNKKFEDILKEEVEIDVYGIKLSYIPKEISPDILSTLLPLVIEDEQAE